jgi:transcriptional regulator with XRE-family HTH domain
MQRKTPAECIGSIIRSAMSAREINAEQLAKLVGVHANTVYSDLHDPDRIQMRRVWLYFTALGVPVDEALQAFADSFARSLVAR